MRGRAEREAKGLLRCVHCGERMQVVYTHKGRVRYYCRSKAQGVGCAGRGSFLDLYEQQTVAGLAAFTLPEGWQRDVLAEPAGAQRDAAAPEQQRRQLQQRLSRLKDLYGWGDLTREQYQAERDAIERALAQMSPVEPGDDRLQRLEAYVRDLPRAWQDAGSEQRNQLASVICESVWVDGPRVEYVKPRSELEPLFQARTGADQPVRAGCHIEGRNVGSGDPDGIRTHDLHRDRVAC